MKFIMLFLFFPIYIFAKSSCSLPSNIQALNIKSGISALKNYPDIRRNYRSLNELCVHLIGFNEGKIHWKMLLVTNPKHSHGLFWYLPHDNENSAFTTAVYAVKKYGGGFLAVAGKGERYFQGQDPNRNFSMSHYRVCSKQKAPSPIYTKIVFSIINTYRGSAMPYLALHNNTNRGGVSILKDNSSTKSFLAYPKREVLTGRGLADEDSIVYIAGSSKKPPMSKINAILRSGLNVKYEFVNHSNNDCSMSNYVILQKRTNKYYNIEAQHGKSSTQKEMVDRLINHIIRR